MSLQNLISGLLNFSLKIQNQEEKINAFKQLMINIQSKLQLLMNGLQEQQKAANIANVQIIF